MTPQEKAKQLIEKMQLDWGCNCCHNDWAKDCALICVDEIIENYDTFLAYWQEVKHEIENL
jgi:hypothetical protein